MSAGITKQPHTCFIQLPGGHTLSGTKDRLSMASHRRLDGFMYHQRPADLRAGKREPRAGWRKSMQANFDVTCLDPSSWDSVCVGPKCRRSGSLPSLARDVEMLHRSPARPQSRNTFCGRFAVAPHLKYHTCFDASRESTRSVPLVSPRISCVT